MDLWYTEKHTPELGITIKVESTLLKEKSEFQELTILETIPYGNVMLLDGLVMLTQKDEFVYHDMISHIPLFSHPNPERVLIIGGGDGGTLREVTRHSLVKKATLVEIDNLVIEASKKYFPETAIGFDSPKAEVLVEDGIKYLKETKEKFDVIIIDSTDPVGPATELFSIEFYNSCYKALKDDGILFAQGESPFIPEMQKTIKDMHFALKDIFPIVRRNVAFIPTYPSGMWSFAYSSKKYDPIKDFQLERYKSENLKFKYYNDEIHIASFALPSFVKEIIS